MGKPKKRIGTLVLQDGGRFPLIGETDRFWLCKGTQFRKSNPAVKKFCPTRIYKPKKRSEPTCPP